MDDQDSRSVAVGAYYAARQGIPAGNVIHLNFSPADGNLLPDDFAPVYAQALASAGPGIQVFAIAWSRPWRVAGMGITSAFALGYDEKYQSSSGNSCAKTAAKALVDRGIEADGTFPDGTSWLVRTSDSARSVRWPAMAWTANDWDHRPDGLDVRYVETASIENQADVFAYLTGLTTVPGIETNT